jgi:hypothetical protein
MDVAEDNEASSSQTPRWSQLLVQFQHHILILNLCQNAASIFSQTADDVFAKFFANISADALAGPSSPAAAISSNALCVDETLLVVGCLDGTVKVYDWRTKKVIQLVHALSA